MKTRYVFLLMVLIMVFASAFNARGMEQWWSSEVELLLAEEDVVVAAANQAVPVEVAFRKFRTFAFTESQVYRAVQLPRDIYNIQCVPLDEQTKQNMKFQADGISFAQPGIYHVRIEVAFDKASGHCFHAHRPEDSEHVERVFLVDRTPESDWRVVDVTEQSPGLTNLVQLIRRENGPVLPSGFDLEWDQALIHDELCYVVDWKIRSFRTRGTLRVQWDFTGGHYSFDGTDIQDLPEPPERRSKPAICVHQNRLFLVGGHKADLHDSTQPVFSMDLETQQWAKVADFSEDYLTPDLAFSHNDKLHVLASMRESRTQTLFSWEEEIKQWSRVRDYTNDDYLSFDPVLWLDGQLLQISSCGGVALLKLIPLEGDNARVLTTANDGRRIVVHDGKIYGVTDDELFLLASPSGTLRTIGSRDAGRR